MLAENKEVEVRGDVAEKKSELERKFDKLKERRAKLVLENKETEDAFSVECSSSTRENMDADRQKQKQGCSKSKDMSEINAYMPYSFTLSSQTNESKQDKLEKEMEDALVKGDYHLSEKLSDEIEKVRYTEQIRGALAARNYTRDVKNMKKKAKRGKNKLKWTFDRKERWETKGNM